MDTYKLRVKIGDFEFDAEGPEDSVKQQFEAFKEIVLQAAPKAEKKEERQEGDVEHKPLTNTIPLDKIIQYDSATGDIILTALPQGDYQEAKAVLLLLLGYKLNKNEENVLVTDLMNGLRRSGCPVGRLDRALAPYSGTYVFKTGIGKGGRYRLTLQGTKEAFNIGQEILKLVA